eukprot:Hpha_TRINITY_DN13331_c0_g1::TRINITY_DN13331_c0_g1_i1::g.95233::m.95233
MANARAEIPDVSCPGAQGTAPVVNPYSGAPPPLGQPVGPPTVAMGAPVGGHQYPIAQPVSGYPTAVPVAGAPCQGVPVEQVQVVHVVHVVPAQPGQGHRHGGHSGQHPPNSLAQDEADFRQLLYRKGLCMGAFPCVFTGCPFGLLCVRAMKNDGEEQDYEVMMAGGLRGSGIVGIVLGLIMVFTNFLFRTRRNSADNCHCPHENYCYDKQTHHDYTGPDARERCGEASGGMTLPMPVVIGIAVIMFTFGWIFLWKGKQLARKYNMSSGRC